jgi:hypothetical protein
MQSTAVIRRWFDAASAAALIVAARSPCPTDPAWVGFGAVRGTSVSDDRPEREFAAQPNAATTATPAPTAAAPATLSRVIRRRGSEEAPGSTSASRPSESTGGFRDIVTFRT